MPIPQKPPSDDNDLSFKVFHELMAKRVQEILLVSSPYDAFIMEEDGRLAERIIHEYSGLNLTRPPRFTWVSSAQEALISLSDKKFDLVITMPSLDDMDPYSLGKEIKKQFFDLPVILLAHDTNPYFLNPEYAEYQSIDNFFVWRGNTDLLLAIIKMVEDRMNVAYDTKRAKVRVIILVEDSPKYLSSILPHLYKEIVLQTQDVIEESINEEHRIVRMRARPKILCAKNFEEAEKLYQQFKPYLLSVLSDVRFPKDGKMDEYAGFSLLDMINTNSPGMPLLVFSSEETNRKKAIEIPAVFLNKNSPSLHTDIRSFLVEFLAFGDFVFHYPDGNEIASVSNLPAMEKILPSIPEASISYHAKQNHFSTWLMARSEIHLASKLRPVNADDFSSPSELKEYLILCLRENRKTRQKGIVIDFVRDYFDGDSDFVKIGKGSLGGKARGLAFISTLFRENPELQEKFPDVNITVPKTLVITTDGFEDFTSQNNLKNLSNSDYSDRKIAEIFLSASFPDWLYKDLESFLSKVKYPLAIRSSSLLEDAQYQPYAGIYKTYMIPNNHSDLSVRLRRLVRAIKLVYASTYFEIPKSYARNTLHRTEEEKMAVVIQQITGCQYSHYYFPAISGVAQSYNFYPISYMKPEEGIAHIALGYGKTVVEGGLALRFSPQYPQFLPQFSTIEDILKNSQRQFFALKMTDFQSSFGLSTKQEKPETKGSTLSHLEIDDMEENIRNYSSLRMLFSSYLPEDHRLKDSVQSHGSLVLTFSGLLKYKLFPLPEILSDILELGRKGMGSPVEIEFAVNFPSDNIEEKAEFALLQIRPMVLRQHDMNVKIKRSDFGNAFAFSTKAMGNNTITDISDIIFVDPDTFDPTRTREISAEIGKMNQVLVKENRKFLLIGPGRWGSADRFLGIPVNWKDISGVGAIIETTHDKLQADPSQGTHFFHNITSLGIGYLTITKKGDNFIDEPWLKSLPAESRTKYIKYVKCDSPLTIKIDGKKSCAVILK